MENTFVVNDEPMTIRITIEIIPPKNKTPEVIKHEESIVVQAPTYKLNPTEELPNAIPKEPVATLPVDPLAAPQKKERKKRAPKTPIEPVAPVMEVKKDSVSTPTTKTTGTARIVKLVTFFCKGQNINPADITIALLKEKAFDIIEGYEDAVVQTAIDEFKKANGK